MDLLGQRQKALINALGGQQQPDGGAPPVEAPEPNLQQALSAAAPKPGMAMGTEGMGSPAGNTGINGAGAASAALSQLAAPPSAPSAEPSPLDASPLTKADAAGPTAGPAQDFGRLMGYDEGKFNDPNKHDFKYDTARTMSQFDPRQGFTPDVIAALNKLDYGTFSGSGDKLSLSGAKNAKDAADFNNQDWIYALKANNGDTKWNFGGGGAGGPQGGGGAADAVSGGGFGGGVNGGLAGAQGNLDSLLQGNPQKQIQDALAALTQGGNRPNLAGLIASLSGGGQ